MRIKALTLFHLELPCKSAFVHAQSTRQSSEVILVKADWENGIVSWGEMLPREYVTGESIRSIMQKDHESTFDLIRQHDIESVDHVIAVLDKLLLEDACQLSYVGGIEIMLLSAIAQQGNLSLNEHLGPIRQTPIGRCVTIGFDCAASQIRARFIDARMKKATSIKLKVGADIERDAHCITQLVQQNKGRMSLRLDGNGAFSYELVSELLSACDTKSLHSFEEPLIFDTPQLSERLLAIKERFDIDIMADESVCSLEDADDIIKSGHYQWFNIRVGKHGGLLASAKIRDKALKAGIGIVGGSMVGETGVLTQASTIFLQRSNDMEYIEGLGQNRSWLVEDPFVSQGVDPAEFCRLDALQHVFEQCVRDSRSYHR